jgi:hypothetical protein
MDEPPSALGEVGAEVVEMTKDPVIKFQAEVSKVSTLADGGIRITLDLPETAIDTAKKLMEARQAGALLEIAAVPVNIYGKTN